MKGKKVRKRKKKCPNDFVRLLHASDGFDSEEDRGKASDKQSICKTCYSNAFGHEREVEVNYKAERNAVYDYILDTCDINKIKTKRREFLDNLRKSFSKALGMTSPSVLKEVDLEDFSIEDENKIKTKLVEKDDKLNLGWLYLENEEKITLEGELNEIQSDIKNRFVLVSDKLFSPVVNSNLEVRTSVAIDPRTGAGGRGSIVHLRSNSEVCCALV